MAFVQGVYLVLVLLEVAQQDVFHVAAYCHLAPAYHRHDTHQLLVRGTAHVQGLSVCQFHFLKVGFPVVTRTALCACGVSVSPPAPFQAAVPRGRFPFRRRAASASSGDLLLGGYALRDKFFHEILVYLRHPAALLCHIIVI